MFRECSASFALPTTSTRDTRARHASPRDVTTTTDSERIEVSVCVIPCSAVGACEAGIACEINTYYYSTFECRTSEKL